MPNGTSSGRCSVCQRQMRPINVKSADRPGTVAYGRAGMCTTCESRDRRSNGGAPVFRNAALSKTAKYVERIEDRVYTADQKAVLQVVRSRFDLAETRTLAQMLGIIQTEYPD